MGERREAKKRETRQRISDVATAMFFAHGFEAVTVEAIAARAGVAKMTVFNYFPRKEDLMLDRQDDLRLVFFRDAIRAQPDAPIGALRALVAGMRGTPFVCFDRATADWWHFVAESPSLQARLRELDEEAVAGLADVLGDTGAARLVAAMIVATVRTARNEGFRVIARGGSSTKARAAFFALIERGFAAAESI